MTDLSPSTPLSPVAFARDYQRYRSEASRVPYADSRLLLAARFWSAREAALSPASHSSYSSYYNEDLPPLLVRITESGWDDLRPEDLEDVARFVDGLPADLKRDLPAHALWEVAARQWLYLGEAQQALEALAHTHALGIATPSAAALISEQVQIENAADLPSALADAAESTHPGLARWLRTFETTCQAIRDTGDSRKAHCLLVEYDSTGKPARGRLRTLEGRIETLKSDAQADEVVFGHQMRAADDPQVAGVYAALAALRRKDKSYYRGTYAFTGSSAETFGGDSLGLAAFAIAYGDRWGSELHRERKLIGSSVAFTGAVDPDGTVRPVSSESLAIKIERAFRSPLEFVVVPEPNRRDAETAVEQLRQEHPHRRLRIIGAERASDILTDHNILRPEKVCIGEFAVRTAARYSRSVKVQVPVLLLLLYALVCVVEPRAWILFDWNPASVRPTSRGFVVLNDKEQEIWRESYSCQCDSTLSQATLCDLDGDGLNELMFMPKTQEGAWSEINAELFIYDHDGDLLVQRSGVILGEYPGDTTIAYPYTPGRLDFVYTRQGPIIVSKIQASYPARGHLQLWKPNGDRIGWYINAGVFADRIPPVLNGDSSTIALLVYNNRYSSLIAPNGCAGLAVLPLDSLHGVSPPYDDPAYDLASVERGNQLAYCLFSPTDLSRALGENYNHPIRIQTLERGALMIETLECSEQFAALNYYLDSTYSVREVRADDGFVTQYARRVSDGTLPEPLRSTYLDECRKNVLYWSDTGWVSGP